MYANDASVPSIVPSSSPSSSLAPSQSPSRSFEPSFVPSSPPSSSAPSSAPSKMKCIIGASITHTTPFLFGDTYNVQFNVAVTNNGLIPVNVTSFDIVVGTRQSVSLLHFASSILSNFGDSASGYHDSTAEKEELEQGKVTAVLTVVGNNGVEECSATANVTVVPPPTSR